MVKPSHRYPATVQSCIHNKQANKQIRRSDVCCWSRNAFRFRNVFLTGPTVVHDKAVFCFIYKYRQRWAIVAREILMRMGRFSDVIAHYKSKGFMLDDLSCCANTCSC